MQRSVLGRAVARWYEHLPVRRFFLSLCIRLEGGQLYSLTLREILRQHFKVELGPYSYGSLAQPGMADKFTTIGPYVSIGPNVRRIGAAHPLDKLSLHPFWYNHALGMAFDKDDVRRTPCAIHADAWIGANVVILPSCTRIGIGAVVGAGSIVTKDVPDFAIVAGNPARQIGERLTAEQRAMLLDVDPWSLEPEHALEALNRIDRCHK